MLRVVLFVGFQYESAFQMYVAYVFHPTPVSSKASIDVCVEKSGDGDKLAPQSRYYLKEPAFLNGSAWLPSWTAMPGKYKLFRQLPVLNVNGYQVDDDDDITV